MEKLKDIVEKSETFKDVMTYLGWNINGSNYSKVKKMIKEDSISIAHFLSVSDFLKKYNNTKEKIPMSVILVENSTYASRGSLKKRLVKESILEYKCVECGNDGNWLGKKFSLILDHKNGINNDNSLDNLRFLCPNCNATLDTHCGKNVKNKKNKKEKLIKPIDFNIRKNEHLRVIIRPTYENLLNEVKENGYSGTGRKYGVSDNTIRKWIRVYEKTKVFVVGSNPT